MGRQVSKKDLAEFFGVTDKTVSSWVSQGAPYVRKGEKGGRAGSWLFDTEDVIAWREEKLRERASGSSEATDLNEAKRRRAAAEAERAEIELRQLRGDLVEIKSVAKTVGDEYAALRAKLLGIPSKLGPQLLGVEDAAEATNLIEREIFAALEELSQDGQLGAETPADAESDAA